MLKERQPEKHPKWINGQWCWLETDWALDIEFAKRSQKKERSRPMRRRF
jgi:hypothetical protein